ncbi:putative RNA-directed DNA polymerase [Helianthus annuus]|nr:putative RNA-directed DNA polymerase [Helianthus annuus]
MTIDRRDPNPMKETGDIQIYNKKIQEQRLYQLLIAIDDKLEPIKRDILKRDPLPSVEVAYAAIRREIARLNILQTTSSPNPESPEIGSGLVARGSAGKSNFRSESQKREKDDKSKLLCTHCNMKKHTKETCFRLVGYPDWWEKPGQKGKAAVAVGEQDSGDPPKAPIAAVGGTNTGGKSAMPTGFGGAAIGIAHEEETVLETQTQEPEEIESKEPPEVRVLPPRKNRGVPPNRFSPEHKKRESKYPIDGDRGRVGEIAKAFFVTLLSENIPRTAQEASETREWQEAMNTDMKALEENNTWEKCELPKGKKPVGCRWVFTIKYKVDGTIERYKARLVAKGYTQTYGIDYSETFSPVAKIDTIRVLLSVAANKDWPLHQFDVKNAFLHGDLKEEVYMEAPPGFSKEFKKNEVCRLKKTLYGLKQSPRAWFGKFTMAMKKYGYKQSNADHTLFFKRRGELVTCLIIYVDDMIITGSDKEEIAQLRENLFKEFEMKDLGGLKYFLGIEVLRSQGRIFISQKKYILDLLVETGMVDCKPVDTPIIVNHNLKISEGAKPADKERYQRLVGKLIYLAHTRPDIAYAVGVVSQFMHQPQKEHMEAVMRIVQYLKGTPGRGIVFKKGEHLNVEAFTDADWASNPNGRRSTSGFFTLLGGNLVTWRSKKQKVVSLSSAESEFRGIVKGITEILWLKKLMKEIGFPLKLPTQLFCDNMAAISISENPVQHDRTKHVEVDRHFIKEKIEDGTVKLPYVKSENQLILTKAVPRNVFNSVLCKLSIEDPTTQLEGEC